MSWKRAFKVFVEVKNHVSSRWIQLDAFSNVPNLFHYFSKKNYLFRMKGDLDRIFSITLWLYFIPNADKTDVTKYTFTKYGSLS